jgi:hypothetical protein
MLAIRRRLRNQRSSRYFLAVQLPISFPFLAPIFSRAY